jgi:hypothetical protein
MNSTRKPMNCSPSGIHCMRSGIDCRRTLALCTPPRTHSTWTAIHSSWTATHSTWKATHCLRSVIISTRGQMKGNTGRSAGRPRGTERLRARGEVLPGKSNRSICRARFDLDPESAAEVAGGYRPAAEIGANEMSASERTYTAFIQPGRRRLSTLASVDVQIQQDAPLAEGRKRAWVERNPFVPLDQPKAAKNVDAESRCQFAPRIQISC